MHRGRHHTVLEPPRTLLDGTRFWSPCFLCYHEQLQHQQQQQPAAKTYTWGWWWWWGEEEETHCLTLGTRTDRFWTDDNNKNIMNDLENSFCCSFKDKTKLFFLVQKSGQYRRQKRQADEQEMEIESNYWGSVRRMVSQVLHLMDNKRAEQVPIRLLITSLSTSVHQERHTLQLNLPGE